MHCPACNSDQQTQLHLSTLSFNEDLLECSECGSRWAIQHEAVALVVDRQENSFLESLSECVEGHDYGYLHA